MPKFLSNVDLNKNQTLNRVAQNLATAPGSPIVGQEYYDTATNATYFWNGATWIATDAAKVPAGHIPLSKLATDPLARANHTGTQTAATISDFDTQVRTSRLDQMAAPTASVSLNSQKITNLAAPTLSGDATTKQYVDDAIAGLAWKDSVRVATTANVTLSGIQTIDGISVAAGERVLAKNQTAAAGNGLWVCASGAWTRATDADTNDELHGMAVFVEEGTQAGTCWTLTTSGTIVVGTTALTYAQFNGGSTYTAGSGLTITGNDFNVGAGTGITVDATSVNIDVTVVVRKYSTLIGDGASTTLTVTHNLNNQDAICQVRQASDNAVIYCDQVNNGANTIQLTFAVAPATNALKASVVG